MLCSVRKLAVEIVPIYFFWFFLFIFWLIQTKHTKIRALAHFCLRLWNFETKVRLKILEKISKINALKSKYKYYKINND